MRNATCAQCGASLTGHQTRFCSKRCESRWWYRNPAKPECAIEGCERKAHARGLCPMHYQRQRTRGTVGTTEPERIKHDGRSCSFEDCDRPRHARDLCAIHDHQFKRTGRLWAIRGWATEANCIVCGRARAPGMRQFCSGACRYLWRTYVGDVPQIVGCVLCGSAIDLNALRVGRGRRVRSDIRICRDCRVASRKYRVSARQLAARDGAICGICGEEVDMTIRMPDRRCASVDHVIPRARGGKNDPTNLQLAHFICNSRKSDSVLAAPEVSVHGV